MHLTTDRPGGSRVAGWGGAAVVTGCEVASMSRIVCGSDGENAQAVRIYPAAGTIRQDGQTVYRWATGQMGDVALRVCRENGIDPADLAAFVPHQVNLRIIDLIAKWSGSSSCSGVAGNRTAPRKAPEKSNTAVVFATTATPRGTA